MIFLIALSVMVWIVAAVSFNYFLKQSSRRYTQIHADEIRPRLHDADDFDPICVHLRVSAAQWTEIEIKRDTY
jgi:hypothetical protein